VSALDSLRQFTTVVADTGDFLQIAKYRPQDATTNPSLILKAVQQAEYAPLLKQTIAESGDKPMDEVVDRLIVRFGCEILSLVPGRVSTEVDARLSFDSDATVKRGERIIALYRAEGVPAERVLIKVAATWEGIQAAGQLERRGIRTNLTLLFSFCQAVACGQAQVQLISPFVGRVYDWFKKHAGANWDESANAGANDPGVRLVRQIYDYYKRHGVETEVMGASFRNVGQVVALAGCDLLTISPELLAELARADLSVPRMLDAHQTKHPDMTPAEYDEPTFRITLNNDQMASEKLAEGIRGFCVDAERLERLIQS
jgi:transaldolase